MDTYRGAWLYGQEHIHVLVGRMKAEWEQFCPVPADIQDGILLKGNVLYRQADGSWRRSPDQFEGVIRTYTGNGGGRIFEGRTQHTFYGPNLPGGKLQVVANLNMRLSQRAPANPLVAMPRPSEQSPMSYSQNSYSPPTLSEPGYEQSSSGSSDSGF